MSHCMEEDISFLGLLRPPLRGPRSIGRGANRCLSLLMELEDTHRKLQEYAVQAEELAAAEERNRLARELHDSVTQTIFSMTFAAESSRILAERDPSKVDAELERLQDLAKGALAEMRALIHQLRPTSVNERGLIPTLQDYVETVRSRDGLNVDLRVEGGDRLPTQSQDGLFRIIQEALNNVSKHAQTDSAVVTLKTHNGHVSLTVEDNGIGFDPSRSGPDRMSLGMSSMRERAEQQGGVMEVESRPGEGTRVKVEMPVQDSPQSDG